MQSKIVDEAPAEGGPEVLQPGFSIIHSNRMEDLRRVAVEWVRRHPLDPLENEVFIVQSNGMAQWLKLALAENDGCGISAALDIQLPARFMWNAYRAVLGAQRIPRDSPYDKTRLTWRLLRLLPELLRDARFAVLKQYLENDEDLRKRYQLACRLADLYDQYQVYRADWLADWAAGRDRLAHLAGDPQDLGADQVWQAELWRRIQADVPEAQRGTSRAGLHRLFLQTITALAARPAGLPRRILVFGISSLPTQVLEALHAISGLCQVLLFVHNPCRFYWADIVEDRELLRIEAARHGRKAGWPAAADPLDLHLHANPLLAAFGKQGRDYIGLLYAYDRPETYRDGFAQIDLFSDVAPQGRGAPLLHQVQQAILDLVPLPARDQDKCAVAVDDASISFQPAFSRQREVEALHDRLLSLFASDRDLKPRDIIVMAPDIEAYAPHIEAVFGNLDPRDARFIPFTIADRPERAGVPMVRALDKLLGLPASRLTVADFLELLEVSALRERFGLNEADVPRLRQWIEGAGIRWGMDARQRCVFDLPDGLEQNTWIFGLRRMLLGYAVGSGKAFAGIEPYDEVGGLEAALVGPLASILEQFARTTRLLDQAATIDQWCARLLELVEAFFLPTGSRDRLTRSRLEEALAQWRAAGRDAGLQEALPLAVVREVVMGALQEAGLSQRFLAGMVNFCTLMPMRAIPFKVVCLLGMNDGEYPRPHTPLSFDLMAMPGRYRPGDRSRRDDDRYLFLEALLSARDTFLVSYIGRSARDNTERMPSVLVGQLRDYLAAGWKSEDPASDLLETLTIRHPLQPFSTVYFQEPRPPGLATYAHEWRESLEARAPAADVALDPPVSYEGGLQLARMTAFLKNPVKFFFNQRLNVHFEALRSEARTSECFALDGLESYGLCMKLLQAGLAVDPPAAARAVDQAAEALRRSGDLPLNGFGELTAAQLCEPARGMLQAHAELVRQWPHSVDPVEISLPMEIPDCPCGSLEDWLPGLRRAAPCASDPLEGDFMRWEFHARAVWNARGDLVRPQSLITLWVRHLAGCARGLRLTSCLIAPDGSRDADQGKPAFAPLDPRQARTLLEDIARHWWLGLSRPLPVTARSGLAWAAALERGGAHEEADAAARKAYEGDGFNLEGELGYGDGVYLQRCYPDFDTLRQAGGGCFATLTETLFAPLLKTVTKL